MGPLTTVIGNYSRFGIFNANHFATDAAMLAILNRKSLRIAFCDRTLLKFAIASPFAPKHSSY